MTKKEFRANWDSIKADALPLIEKRKIAAHEMLRLEDGIAAHVRRKYRLQHSFFGCYNCTDAIDSKLGVDACCNYPGGLDHERKHIDDLSTLREESPACSAFTQGEPQHQEPDPLEMLMEAMRSVRRKVDEEPVN